MERLCQQNSCGFNLCIFCFTSSACPGTCVNIVNLRVPICLSEICKKLSMQLKCFRTDQVRFTFFSARLSFLTQNLDFDFLYDNPPSGTTDYKSYWVLSHTQIMALLRRKLPQVLSHCDLKVLRVHGLALRILNNTWVSQKRESSSNLDSHVDLIRKPEFNW